jgi:hypothetical protein
MAFSGFANDTIYTLGYGRLEKREMVYILGLIGLNMQAYPPLDRT